jgi:hypothetical protein
MDYKIPLKVGSQHHVATMKTTMTMIIGVGYQVMTMMMKITMMKITSAESAIN